MVCENQVHTSSDMVSITKDTRVLPTSTKEEVGVAVRCKSTNPKSSRFVKKSFPAKDFPQQSI